MMVVDFFDSGELNEYRYILSDNSKNYLHLSTHLNSEISIVNHSNSVAQLSQDELSLLIDCAHVDSRSVELIVAITDQILIIYPWFMVICGTICNLLSFTVIHRTKLKKSSTFVYLACLSLIDLSILYTFCINFIFLYQFKIDLQFKHIILCKVYSFLIYFLPQLSGWTVAAVSLDRVIGVIFSVRGKYAAAARRWNTPKKAYKVILTIFLVLFLLNVQFFFYPNEYHLPLNETIPDINLIYCSPENIPRYERFYNVWVYIDLSVNVLIPFAVMIVCSVIIVIGLIKSTKNLAISQSTNSSCKSPRVGEEVNVTVLNTQHNNQVRFKSFNSGVGGNSGVHMIENNEPLISHTSSLKKRMSTSSTSGLSAKARSVSSMLATNNLVFISLTLPIVVFLSVTPPFAQMCDDNKAKTRLVKVICIVLMNTNCMINIFVYSLMASEFRRQLFVFLREVFCIKKKSMKKFDMSSKRSIALNININNNNSPSGFTN